MMWRTILTALVAVQAMTTPVQADVVEIHPGGVSDGCAASGSAERHEILEERPWVATENAAGLSVASKGFVVEFTSWDEFELPVEGAGDPTVGVKNCSSGVCSVVVHVYAESVSSVKTHAGFFAFLPWAFAKVTVTQEVEVEKESEITCAGETFVTLTGSGGVGPRSFTASIWRDEGTQEVKQCQYLNVPGVDEQCDVFFAKDFELSARTPGEYTRFDIVNGGRFSNQLLTSAPLGYVDVLQTPAIEVGGFEADPIILGESGEWRTVLGGIEIKVDTTEATNLLRELANDRARKA